MKKAMKLIDINEISETEMMKEVLAVLEKERKKILSDYENRGDFQSVVLKNDYEQREVKLRKFINKALDEETEEYLRSNG